MAVPHNPSVKLNTIISRLSCLEQIRDLLIKIEENTDEIEEKLDIIIELLRNKKQHIGEVICVGETEDKTTAFIIRTLDNDGNITAEHFFVNLVEVPEPSHWVYGVCPTDLRPVTTRLDTIIQEVDGVEESLTNLETTTNNILTQTTEINQGVQTLNTEVTSIGDDVENIETHTVSIDNKLTETNTALGTVNTNLTNINQNVDEVEQDLTTINTTLLNDKNVTEEVICSQGKTTTEIDYTIFHWGNRYWYYKDSSSYPGVSDTEFLQDPYKVLKVGGDSQLRSITIEDIVAKHHLYFSDGVSFEDSGLEDTEENRKKYLLSRKVMFNDLFLYKINTSIFEEITNHTYLTDLIKQRIKNKNPTLNTNFLSVYFVFFKQGIRYYVRFIVHIPIFEYNNYNPTNDIFFPDLDFNPTGETVSGGGGGWALHKSIANPITHITTSTEAATLTVTKHFDNNNNLLDIKFWNKGVLVPKPTNWTYGNCPENSIPEKLDTLVTNTNTTNEKTDEVKEILTDIKDITTNIENNTQQGSATLNTLQQINENIDDVENSLNSINSTTTSTNTSVVNIESNLKNLTQQNTNISKELHQINENTDGVENSLTNITTGLTEIKGDTEHIETTTVEIRDAVIKDKNVTETEICANNETLTLTKHFDNNNNLVATNFWRGTTLVNPAPTTWTYGKCGDSNATTVNFEKDKNVIVSEICVENNMAQQNYTTMRMVQFFDNDRKLVATQFFDKETLLTTPPTTYTIGRCEKEIKKYWVHGVLTGPINYLLNNFHCASFKILKGKDIEVRQADRFNTALKYPIGEIKELKFEDKINNKVYFRLPLGSEVFFTGLFNNENEISNLAAVEPNIKFFDLISDRIWDRKNYDKYKLSIRVRLHSRTVKISDALLNGIKFSLINVNSGNETYVLPMYTKDIHSFYVSRLFIHEIPLSVPLGTYGIKVYFSNIHGNSYQNDIGILSIIN